MNDDHMRAAQERPVAELEARSSHAHLLQGSGCRPTGSVSRTSVSSRQSVVSRSHEELGLHATSSLCIEKNSLL